MISYYPQTIVPIVRDTRIREEDEKEEPGKEAAEKVGSKEWIEPKLKFYSSLEGAIGDLRDDEAYIYLPILGKERFSVIRSSNGEVKVDYIRAGQETTIPSPMESSRLRVVRSSVIVTMMQEVVDEKMLSALRPLLTEKINHASEELSKKEAVILEDFYKLKGKKSKGQIVDLLRGVREDVLKKWEEGVMEKIGPVNGNPGKLPELSRKYREVVGKFMMSVPIIPELKELDELELVKDLEDWGKIAIWRKTDQQELKSLVRILHKNSKRELYALEGEIEVSPKQVPEVIVIPAVLSTERISFMMGFTKDFEEDTQYFEKLILEPVYMAKANISAVRGENITCFIIGKDKDKDKKDDKAETPEKEKIEFYQAYIRKGTSSSTNTGALKNRKAEFKRPLLLRTKIYFFLCERENEGALWKREPLLEARVSVYDLHGIKTKYENGVNNGNGGEDKETTEEFVIYVEAKLPNGEIDFYNRIPNRIDEVAKRVLNSEVFEARELVRKKEEEKEKGEEEEEGQREEHEDPPEENLDAWYLSDRLATVIESTVLALREWKDTINQKGHVTVTARSEGNLYKAYKGLIHSLAKPWQKERLVFGGLKLGLCLKDKETGEECSIFPLNVSGRERDVYERARSRLSPLLLLLPEDMVEGIITSILSTPLKTSTEVEHIIETIVSQDGGNMSLLRLIEKTLRIQSIKEYIDELYLQIAEEAEGTEKIEVDIYKEEEKVVATKIVKNTEISFYLRTSAFNVRGFEKMEA